MFQNAQTTQLSKAIDELNEDYLIKPGDEINIKLYSRKGAQLVEAIRTNVTNPQELNSATMGGSSFVVSNNGTIVLPILGELVVDSLTESELKQFLERKFEKDYIQPFVHLKVENRRVFLFKGNMASVVSLNRTPTSIIEVIAKSGGLDRHMSSSDIMIIRGDLKEPTVFKVNLQTFKDIKKSEIVLQSNDIVYIPEKKRNLYYSMQDLAPIISTPLAILSGIMSTVVLLVTISK